MTHQEVSIQIGLFAEPIHDRQIGSPMHGKGEAHGRQEI